MMTTFTRLLALLGALLVLAGCAGAGEPLASAVLPLAKNGPTFLFFFTDP